MKSILTLFIACALISPAWGLLQPLKVSHIPADILSHAIGPLDPKKNLRLAVELPIAHAAELKQFLQDLYTPASPQYHHYLTPKQFTEKFGPTQADYDTVAAFFKSHGFKITAFANRQLLDIEGTVDAVQQVFHTSLKMYRNPANGSTFYAPDGIPSLDLNVPLADVAGLDNYTKFHPLGGVH